MVRRVLLLVGVAAVTLSLAACASATPAECPTATRVDLSNVDPDDHSLPFRYPLDIVEVHAREADFCEHSLPEASMHHAAEDFWRPPGTPVYAMADGEVSFSGPMGGYGWLVIVDHAQMNIYSLYGHLSPSRWKAEPGPVAKGDLIGYLGDEWENGGSRDEPLVAHLHLGVRAGLRTDYPGRGEWRWMAGWIKSCPSDLGWLQPSSIIAAQSVPEGGFAAPEGQWLQRWSVELIILAATAAGIIWWIVVGIRRRSWIIPLLVGGVAILGGLYFTHQGFILAPYGFYTTAAIAAISAGIIAYRRRHAHA